MNAGNRENPKKNLKDLLLEIRGLITFPLEMLREIPPDFPIQKNPLWKEILEIPLGLILWGMVLFVLVLVGIIFLPLGGIAFGALKIYEILWAGGLGRYFLKKVPSPLGYRAFRVHYNPNLGKLILTSCYFSARWEGPTLKADLAPRRSNDRGIYAFDGQRTLYEELSAMRKDYGPAIFGRLEQHGNLCFHSQGCRSEWGTIWELALPLCFRCEKRYSDFLVYSNFSRELLLGEGRGTCFLCEACLATLKESGDFILEKVWTAWEAQEILGERYDCPVHPAPWWHLHDYHATLEIGDLTLRVAPGEPDFPE